MSKLVYTGILLCWLFSGQLMAQPPEKRSEFYLEFVKVGFGSNKFRMQPAFRITDSTFVYTSEQIWIRPGQVAAKDTLLTGTFRKSAADSIRLLVYALPDSIIDRPGNGIISGSGKFITIITDGKKWSFNLFNASEPTADRIIDILNTHLPKNLSKLPVGKSKLR